MNGRHFRYVLRATQVSESLNDRSEQKFITRIKLSALGKADILRAHEFACLLLPKPDKMMRCSQCIFPAKSGPTEKSLKISSRRRHQDHGGTALRGYPGLGDRSTPSEPVSLGIVNRCWDREDPVEAGEIHPRLGHQGGPDTSGHFFSYVPRTTGGSGVTRSSSARLRRDRWAQRRRSRLSDASSLADRPATEQVESHPVSWTASSASYMLA